MGKFIEGERLGIIGKSGYGKSYLTKKKIIPELVKYKPVVIIDPKPDYFGRAAKDHSESWLGFYGFIEFAKHVINKQKIEKKVYVICPKSGTDVKGIINLIWDAQIPVSLLIDEAHNLKSKDWKDEALTPLFRTAREGRSKGIDLILISQRLTDLEPDIRSQLDGIISFYQNHPNDVKALELIDYQAGNKVNSLDKREYVKNDLIPARLKNIV